MTKLRNIFRSAVVLCVSVMAGCAATDKSTTRESFVVQTEQATAYLSRQDAKRTKLDRPLVILGGFAELGLLPALMEKRLREQFDGTIIRVTFADLTRFPDCRRRLVETLDARLGLAGETETAEVDVLGMSMGGLVAVYSAIDDPGLGKRVKIRRAFTIGSPLQGAKLARRWPFVMTDMHRDMIPGSALLKRIAAEKRDYELVSYSRLGDRTVGAAYASLPGSTLHWVDNPWLSSAHVGSFWDARILGDIVRRLRGEEPFTLNTGELPASETK
jgi:pimeloyl-ACP methyl ester carboxylesterase